MLICFANRYFIAGIICFNEATNLLTREAQSCHFPLPRYGGCGIYLYSVCVVFFQSLFTNK